MNLQFHTIYNCRKPTTKLPLFRYAALDHSSPEEIDKFFQTTGITHRIDLRSPVEVWKSKNDTSPPPSRTSLLARSWKTYGKNQNLESNNAKHNLTESITLKLRPSQMLNRKTKKSSEPLVLTSAEHINNQEIIIYNVNFLNKNYIDNAIWDKFTVKEKWKIFIFMITFQYKKIMKMIGDKLKIHGLLGTYKDFIDYSQHAIDESLKHITMALEKNAKIGVNCQFAKDRTGIVVAFIKYIINEPLDDILQDYAESEIGLKDILPYLETEFINQGLPEEFALSPSETMKNTFTYIEAKYKSIDQYLDSIGFNSEWRMRLKQVTTNLNSSSGDFVS